MKYHVLYRTYRPKAFKEVIGQEHIVQTLKNVIKNDKIAHAYIFAGPRGTGKTTIAKIFAKAVNCMGFINEPCNDCDICQSINEGKNPDVIEMDAASNNSVDNIRQIVNEVNYAPSISKYKVYIIDEAHMLSDSAFNALLKTLEEPPEHVIFILATTDPQKVLPTVLSRCQRFNFSKLTKYEILTKLKEILDKENIVYEDNALLEIASLADGGMRDALSILEEVISFSENGINLSAVEKIFGLTSTKELVSLFVQAIQGEKIKVISKLRELYKAGRDLKRISIDLLVILKEVLIYEDNRDESLLEKINKDQAEEILKLVSTHNLLEDILVFQNLSKDLSLTNESLSFVELAFLKLCPSNNKTSEIINKAQEIKNEYHQDEVKKIIEDDNCDIDRLAKILCKCTRSDKENDAIIYNKLEIYSTNVKFKRYYDLLINTKLFASCKDAILVMASRDIALAINDPEINEGLYNFLLDEYGIDKMVIAFNHTISNELIQKGKYYLKNPFDPVLIKKYEKKTEKTQEEKLKEVFGAINNVS